ncbi:MAG: leucine-rich repeat protein [Prevotella sp.]|nr:leucine-rich repeat protein [Prevotella sp.]
MAVASCLLMSVDVLAGESVIVDGLKYELDGTEAYLFDYEGEPTDVVIPETIESEGQVFRVTYIMSETFYQCSSITSLTATGANLVGIGYFAFMACPNLKQVNVVCEDFVGEAAFYDCASLEEVHLACNRISDFAFAFCGNLQRVVLTGVKSIGHSDYKVDYKYTTDINVGYTFAGCPNLVFVDLGNDLESVSQAIFANCSKLPYIIIPSTCRTFYYKEKWVYSDDESFAYCYLRKDDFNSSYNNIFANCTRLQSIISLGDQTSQCGSNAAVYQAKEQIHWNSTSFEYQGKVPEVTFTSDMPAGFTPSADLTILKKDVGTYTQNVPFTFTNDDMSFFMDIPYTYTIKPATLTAKVQDVSRLYGDENPQFSSNYTGFVSGEDDSVLTNHGTITTTATKKSNVGAYPIKQSGAKAQNYVFTYVDGTLTVNKAPLTMTANDKTMTYGSTVPTLDVTYQGLKNNETVPAWTTALTITTTATKTSKVGFYPITISDAEAKNYDLTIHNGTLTVEKAPLTAKVDNKSRLYGDSNPEFTLTFNGLKNGENVPEWEQQPSFETTATTKSNVGTYPVTLKNAVAVNYDITPIDGTLTVNKAPLKIMPKDVTRKYGEQNPAFELLYEGLRNSENQPEWTVEPIITTNATQGSSVGEYTIHVNNAEARNYTLEKGNGKLTITKAPLTIRLKDATRKYGMQNPNFELEYTGLVNEETAPAWISYPTIATTASEKSDIGEYPITAEGGELKNYDSDGITPAVLTVTPASLLIKAQDASKIYYDENPQLNFTCTGFAADDNPTSFTTMPVVTTTATQESPVGLYPIEVSGGDIKNYQLTYEKGQLEVTPRTLTVSTNDYTRAYGEENPAFELHYKGFVNDEDEDVLLMKPKASTTATKDSDTGIYDIAIGNGIAENYIFTYVGGKLTIEKAYQTMMWE